MENFKEISARDLNTQRFTKITNFEELFKNLGQYSELRFTDHEGRPYAFKKFENRAETSSDSLDNAIEGDNFAVDFTNIKNSFIELNDDQRDIIMHIYFMYKNNLKTRIYDDNCEICDEYNPKIILLGPAGSGKTTIIHFIEKLITWEEKGLDKIKVLKCAFTGKAAFNIDGFTLNNIFSIPFYNTRSLSKKRLSDKMAYFEECIFFICDEISMVGEGLMTSVNMRLTQIFKNDNLYGDRSVLLVGDLYQIDPVKQKPIYPKSKLWTCCEFFELTKIIRQQDERFINALNNFRDSRMTEEDIQLLKSREIQNIDQVPDNAIHLFYLNKHVNELNETKLNKTNKTEVIVNAVEDWNPSQLRVMVDIRYMITYNMDFGDGLINGTTGVVKGFDYDENNSVNTIWMEFHSDKIGARARSKYFQTQSNPGFEKWVPIQRSKVLLTNKNNPKTTKYVDNMFPLKAAEAITVHKSQGQTYHEGVCIHITDDKYDKLRTNKTLQYVALTRVTRLEDLYICGSLDFSITNSKFNRIEEIINQMRAQKKLKLAFETFEDHTGDVIMFLNTGLTYNEHHEFITADRWYGNASLLILTETNTVNTSNNILMPNFKIAFQFATRSGVGMICYKKSNISMDVLHSFCDEANKFYLTLFLFEKYLYIIAGAKGDIGDESFEEALRFLMLRIDGEKCISFLGDFYMDQLDVFDEFELKIRIPSNTSAINGETQYDLVLAHNNYDIPENQIGFYEYIPSSHKPIYVKLPPQNYD